MQTRLLCFSNTPLLWHCSAWKIEKAKVITSCYDIQAGQRLLLGALNYISREQIEPAIASRIGIIYNPRDASQEPTLLAKLLLVTSQLTSRRPKITGTSYDLLHVSLSCCPCPTVLANILQYSQLNRLTGVKFCMLFGGLASDLPASDR